MSGKIIAAALVHVLTASGIIPAILAIITTAQHRFEAAFWWLGLAFIIDGIDGPLARHFHVKEVLPRFCGERLDLIVDYFTYVVVPAFMVYQAQLVPEALKLAAALMMTLTSLYHFSDKESKTSDGYFVGFPAIWNLVVFYFFAVPVNPIAAFAVIFVLSGLTFVPLKWLHPVRVTAWRPVTFAVMVLWAATAMIVTGQGFPASPLCQAMLIVTGLYGLALGLIRSAEKNRKHAAAE